MDRDEDSFKIAGSHHQIHFAQVMEQITVNITF